MKVSIIKKCFTGTVGNLMVGEEYDLHDNIAQKLIDRGYAKKAVKKKTVKLDNRQMDGDDLSVPEAE